MNETRQSLPLNVIVSTNKPLNDRDQIFIGAIEATRAGAKRLLPMVAPFAERVLRPSDTAKKLAAVFASENPLQTSLFLARARQPMPDKLTLADLQYQRLLQNSATNSVLQTETYPDVGGIPTDLTGFTNPLLRFLTAINPQNSHPSYGTPELAVVRDKNAENIPRELHKELLGDLKLVRSFDRWVLRKMYPKNRINQVHIEAGSIAKEVAYAPFTEKQREVSNIRFLGLENEDEFRVTTKEMLLDEMESAGCDALSVKKFLEFAENSDNIRERIEPGSSKRKTGEAYYCHYLAASWILWTIIKPEIESGRISSTDATQLVSTAAIHDLREDLPTHIEWNATKQMYSLEVGDNSNTIEITRNQHLLLDAVTKNPEKDWIESVIQIHEPNRPYDTELNAKLQRYAAILKMSDRWVNFVTLVAGCDNTVDAMRKLEETKRVFARFATQTLLNGLSVQQMIEKIDELNRVDMLDTLVMGLPILADMEQRILESQYGVKVFDEVHRRAMKREGWARNVWDVILRDVVGNHEPISDMQMPWRDIKRTNNAGKEIPWWKVRANIIFDIYNTPPPVRENSIPTIDLEKHVGLDYFVKSNRYKTLPKPLRIEHLAEVVRDVRVFNNSYMQLNGIILGQVDGIYMPVDLSTGFNLQLQERKRIQRILYGYAE